MTQPDGPSPIWLTPCWRDVLAGWDAGRLARHARHKARFTAPWSEACASYLAYEAVRREDDEQRAAEREAEKEKGRLQPVTSQTRVVKIRRVAGATLEWGGGGTT